VLGKAVGCNTGAAIAAGFGRLAEAEASGAGGFASTCDGDDAAVVVADNGVLGTAGSGAVAGALASIAWAGCSAGFGVITAVATGVSEA